MPDKKLTDSEIVKALKEILKLMLCEGDLQRSATISNALDLINRLQAENEKLNKINFDLCNAGGQLLHKVDTIKTEAYKECIEKIHTEIAEALNSNYKAKAERMAKPKVDMADIFISYCEGKIAALRGIDDFADDILKELVGDEK